MDSTSYECPKKIASSRRAAQTFDTVGFVTVRWETFDRGCSNYLLVVAKDVRLGFLAPFYLALFLLEFFSGVAVAVDLLRRFDGLACKTSLLGNVYDK